MYGALLGDMIGAPMEFDRGERTKEFPLFSEESMFTDDSVMTAAVAEALMGAKEDASDDEIRKNLIRSMKKWGRRYPNAGYGGRFYYWVMGPGAKPYNSCGNGSAMRVSPAGWLYDTLEETCRIARLTADVTHNHPEGIKGAESVAAAIFLARGGASKEEIRQMMEEKYHYDLSRSCEEIRRTNRHTEICQTTVPEAVTAFLESEDFEDCIRNAVSFGGDTDTLAAIAGSIAEAFYGVPEELVLACRERLAKDLLGVCDAFARMKKG